MLGGVAVVSPVSPDTRLSRESRHRFSPAESVGPSAMATDFPSPDSAG
jgi:hypothetical protein